MAEPDRIYLEPPQAGEVPWRNLTSALLAYMESEVDGHPDSHDPVPVQLVIAHENGGGFYLSAQTFVGGEVRSGDTPGLGVQLMMPEPYGNQVLMHFGTERKPPIRAAHPFKWAAIDDKQFERLLHRLFADMDNEYDAVQWLQKPNAPDDGRDISARRIEGEERVMIQAKHWLSKSLSNHDLSDCVDDAELWDPPFEEVIVATTGAFTLKAVRFAETRNARTKQPKLTLLSGGDLEVLLVGRPWLVQGLRLR